jgi:hypothetical protein
MKTTMVFWSGAMLLICLVCGCSDIGDEPLGFNPPPPGVSFSAEIQPILNSYCAISFCHGSPSPPNNLNLSDYAGVMTSGIHSPVVIAFEADSSYLVQKIEGTAQPRMPQGGPYLSQATIDLIRQWISEGAQDN